MKFIHIADIHFDSSFVNLSDKEALGDIKRLEQRKVFKKVIEYIKENSIDFLFIAGIYQCEQTVQGNTESDRRIFRGSQKCI